MLRLSSRNLQLGIGGRLTGKVSSVVIRGLQGLTVGVPKETLEGEHRVAMTPVHAAKLIKAGATIKIESNAGAGSGFTDDMFRKVGAEITIASDVWKSQVVAKVLNQNVIILKN